MNAAPASRLGHLYHRVSAASQLLGDGLDRQLEGTQRYVEREGLEIVTTYSDRGVSAYRGKNRRVGELALILRHIEQGVIRPGEHLVIESIDRLSRQPPLDALETLKLILAKGVVVHSVFEKKKFTLESINADLSALLTLVISMARANEESRVKSQRVAEAHARARETGRIIAGSIPTWLRTEKDPKTGEKRFVIKEREAQIVRSMFEMSARGLSSYRIAAELTEQGIEPFGNQRRRIGSKSNGAHHWNATSIIDIITGRKVLGEHVSHTISYDDAGKRIFTPAKTLPRYYEPIIDEDLWVRANRAMKDRKRSVKRGRTGETFANLLRDIIVCDHCHRAMHFKVQFEHRSNERYIRLRCSGRSENVCDNNRMPRYQPIEDAVLTFVTEVDLADKRSEEVAAFDRLITADTIQVEKLNGEIRQIVNLMLSGSVSSDAVGSMVVEKEAEKATISERLDGLQHKRDMIAARMSPQDRRAALAELRRQMAQAEGAELYAIRVALNQRIRETIDQIRFRKGAAHTVLLNDQARFYTLEEADGGFIVSKTVPGGERQPDIEARFNGVGG